MVTEQYWFIFLNAALINNFVLSTFLGICPFLGVSGKISTATRMGAAVSFVMLIASVSAYGIHNLLVRIDAQYLQLISYIVVIASTVQLVEMVIKKFSPALFKALGIFLPLITTNCAILGLALFQTNRGYDFLQSLSFAVGAGAGFTLALLIMSGIREELQLSAVPNVLKGAALTLMVAGILSMAFMGFAGLGGQ
ncbi:MAG: RnfABCDGE type electron transport complex subunit A [Calditrichae bacterium]|nr:RnfABCDGE type electron transport complex subunit A [Calditrichota bacterium]MCB9058261.1 RnfABCDGE type electron transport complex subunit A [Calditrichia bacterium]